MGTIETKTKEDIFNTNKKQIDQIKFYIQQYLFWYHMDSFKKYFPNVNLQIEQKSFFAKQGSNNQFIIEIKEQPYFETQIANNKDNKDIFPNILYLIEEQIQLKLNKTQLNNDNVLYMLQIIAASGKEQYGKKINTSKLSQNKIGTLRDLFTDITEAKELLTNNNYLNDILEAKKNAPVNIDKLGGKLIQSFDINSINVPSLIASSFSKATDPTHPNSAENQLRMRIYNYGKSKKTKQQEFKLYVAKSVTQNTSENQFGLWTTQENQFKKDIYFECKIISNFGLEIPLLVKYNISSNNFKVIPKTFICMTNKYELNQYHLPVSKIMIYELPISKFNYQYQNIDKKDKQLDSILKIDPNKDFLIIKLKKDTGFSFKDIEYTNGETFDALGLSRFKEDGSYGRNKDIFYRQNMNGYKNLTEQYNLLHPQDKKTVQEIIEMAYDVVQSMPKTDCYRRNFQRIQDRLTEWKKNILGIQDKTTYGINNTNMFGIYLRPRSTKNINIQTKTFGKADYLIAKKYINWMIDNII